LAQCKFRKSEEARGIVSKPVLKVAILVTGVLLSAAHYKLKPKPDDEQIRNLALQMGNSTEWRGAIAPDFQVQTTRGETFRLSENVGKKIIVLNFFATWCGPCRAEMPELNSYFNQHKGESFLLMGIDSEETPDRVEAFLNDLKVDFPAAIDSGPIQKQYGVTAFPTTVLIGVDGKVQFYEAGGLANAEVAFDNLLKENRKLLESGRVISADEYRLQAQKQPTLPVNRREDVTPPAEEFKLDVRAQQIVEHMACPCGCDKKVQVCTCHTSKNVKNALAKEDFKGKSDTEVMQALNKRYCGGPM
jgi:peroxiredoxin